MNTESVENEPQDSVLKGVDKGRVAESGTVYATTSKNLHELGSKQDIEGFKDFVQSKQFQKLTAEEKAKTIEQVTKEHRSITALKDLAAKLAHRIGGKVEFENKTNVDWKGYNQGMKSVLNEAYMTPDTPFHEILAHPIIRAIKFKDDNASIDKSKRFSDEYYDYFRQLQQEGKSIKEAEELTNKKFYIKENTLYQNLLKELETGRGKEVFEQVKRDYKSDGFKQSPAFVKWLQDKGIVELQNPITYAGKFKYSKIGRASCRERVSSPV